MSDKSVPAMTDAEVEAEIAGYEAMYGMSSEDFLEQCRLHTAPDTFETNDWRILLKHRSAKES